MGWLYHRLKDARTNKMGDSFPCIAIQQVRVPVMRVMTTDYWMGKEGALRSVLKTWVSGHIKKQNNPK